MARDTHRFELGAVGALAMAATAAAQAWEPLTPPARTLHSVAYDVGRNRLILFGGLNTRSERGSQQFTIPGFWEHDGIRWTSIGGPEGGAGAALAFDQARGRTVLFAGSSSFVPPLGATWEYDGSTWTPIAGAAVTAIDPRLAYDVLRGHTVLYGMDPTTNTSRCWRYDGATWTPFAVAGLAAPASRQGSALAFDTRRGVIVLSGGRNSSPTWTSDTWELQPTMQPSFTRVGLGCAGSAGVPQLDRAGILMPGLGSVFVLNLTSLPPTGAAVLGLGFDLTQWRGLALPIDLGPFGMPGCNVWVAADDQVLLPVTNGTASLAVVIPSSPAFAGVAVGAQALSLDPAASNGIGALSNGVIAVLR